MNDYDERLLAIQKLNIENGTVLHAQFHKPEAPEIIPGIPGRILPAHCRVQIELKPAPESRILVEIWLPTENWNGDFLGTGNGGYAGSIVTLELINGVRRGYAVANTDLGTSPDVDDLIGKPERWKDFGYRATHLMTVIGKQVVEAFYGVPPKVSLFKGSSTGGQQALMEAQRYPEDYDGILAIAPAHNRTHLHYGFIWNWLALAQASGISDQTAREMTAYLLQKYEKAGSCLPGDRFFTSPQNIPLDPNIFEECAALNSAQKAAMRKILQGAADPATGKQIFCPLYTPGSEAVDMGLPLQSQADAFAHDFFYLFRWVYGKGFDFHGFDFQKDVQQLDDALAPYLNAVDPDLSAFHKAGGKLLMLHGMADPIIPYRDSLDYYHAVVTHTGSLEETQKFFRYFLVPGFGHTIGGPGVQDISGNGFQATPQDRGHDALVALADWVKQDIQPDRMYAVAFEDGNILNGILKDRCAYERPCYAYPGHPQFLGGNPNDPACYGNSQFGSDSENIATG